MSQQGHTNGTKTQSTSPASYPPAPLSTAQLAATSDLTSHNDLVSLNHRVSRVDTRSRTMEKLLTRISEQMTTFTALDPTAPAATSSRLSAVHYQPASTPGKHGVPLRTSSNAPLLPRKRLKMLRDRATPTPRLLLPRRPPMPPPLSRPHQLLGPHLCHHQS